MGYIPLLDSTGQRKQRTPVAEIQTVLRVRKVDGSQVFPRGRRGVHNGSTVRQRTQGIQRRSPHHADITHLVSDVNLVDSLVGVVVCITGETPRNAKHAIYEVVKNRDDMCHETTHVNLDDALGRRTA